VAGHTLRRLALDAERELRAREQPLDRELNAAFEAAARRAPLLVERDQRVDVLLRVGAAIRTPGELRENLAGAGPLGARRCTAFSGAQRAGTVEPVGPVGPVEPGTARENTPARRRIPRPRRV